jgi:hypothetical protein
MLLINRFKLFKISTKLFQPTINGVRSIGNVSQSGEVNIFDLFHTKKLQKERAARK